MILLQIGALKIIFIPF